jgi:hypothetical protein
MSDEQNTTSSTEQSQPTPLQAESIPPPPPPPTLTIQTVGQGDMLKAIAAKDFSDSLATKIQTPLPPAEKE